VMCDFTMKGLKVNEGLEEKKKRKAKRVKSKKRKKDKRVKRKTAFGGD
jgi:hypothetical protein